MGSKSGFTIVELLIVIGLIGVLTGLTLSYGVPFYRRRMLKGQSDKIISSLREARSKASYGKNDSAFGVKFKLDSYVFFAGDNFSSRDQKFDLEFDLPSAIEVSGTDEVVFLQNSGNPSFTDEIIVSLGELQQKISINSEGVIRAVKPEEFLVEGILAHWRMDEGSGNTAHDSINENDGTIYGGANWTDGVSGSALEFDGTDDYVNVGTLGDFGSGAEKATYSFWLKFSHDNTEKPFGMGASSQWPFQLEINQWGAGSLRVYIRDTNSDALYTSTGDVNANDGNWHHWAIVVDSANNVIDIYKDGTSLNVTTSGNENPGQFENYGTDFLIGAFNNRGTPSSYFEGSIDELRIYDRVLTQEEVQTIYDSEGGG